MVKPINQERKGSTHENVDAIPVDPANKASTGVMQQSEALIAVKQPVNANEFDDLLFMILHAFR